MSILDNAKNAAANKFGRTLLKVKKNSPEILIAVGIGGLFVSTIMACSASRKIDDTLDEVKEDIENVKKETSEEDKGKELTKAYVKGGAKIVKLYLPAASLWCASLGAILYSHDIMKKRNVALMAAYSAIDESYKKYRERVISEFGENVDRRMKYGAKEEKIDVLEVDEEGKEHHKKIKAENINSDDLEISDYARFFDSGSIHWTKDPETNLFKLRQIQRYANETLKARGHLFLNEVYDMLDIPRTKQGAIVGWISDGTDKVDLGIYNLNSEAHRRFVNGCEANILLDFNVDGVIYDLI